MEQSIRIHPSVPSAPQSTALSIIDSSVSGYAPCSALWIYPPGSPYDLGSFHESLKAVLSTYPQYSGRLHIPPYDPALVSTDHTRRFGRVHLSWGNAEDPGVGFTTSTSSKATHDFLESPGQLHPVHAVPWELYPDFKLLPNLRDRNEIKPCLLVKATLLSDGGLALALAFHHCLSDTQTLCTFVRDWAACHRHSNPSPRPFDPLLLDSCAAGDIDSPEEDSITRSKALDLPQIRLDWWAGHPDGIGRSPRTPHASIDHLDLADGRPRGPRIPWETWDTSLPVADRYLRFTPEEIEAIWRTAGNGLDRVSRLDALLAHLWKIIVRARCVGDNDEVFFDMSIGLRNRVDPPLPETFLGSPLINASPSMTASALSHAPLPEVARKIRETVGQINKDTVPSLLHHLGFALDPEREWNAFLGSHHLMVTSWLGTGAWEVDFGGGLPVDFGAGIGALDGLVVVMDEKPRSSETGGLSRRWYQNGVRVRLCILEKVMERVLMDPRMRS